MVRAQKKWERATQPKMVTGGRVFNLQKTKPLLVIQDKALVVGMGPKVSKGVPWSASSGGLRWRTGTSIDSLVPCYSPDSSRMQVVASAIFSQCSERVSLKCEKCAGII